MSSYSYVRPETSEAFALAHAHGDLADYYTEVHVTAEAMWPVVKAAITWATGGSAEQLRQMVVEYEQEHGADKPFSSYQL